MKPPRMSRPGTSGSEEARNDLPRLLQAAEHGRPTVITRRGRPIAAIVPVDTFLATEPSQKSLLGLAGSGRKLWGRDSRQRISGLREEWNR